MTVLWFFFGEVGTNVDSDRLLQMNMDTNNDVINSQNENIKKGKTYTFFWPSFRAMTVKLHGCR